jgi:hypothetical protein
MQFHYSVFAYLHLLLDLFQIYSYLLTPSLPSQSQHSPRVQYIFISYRQDLITLFDVAQLASIVSAACLLFFAQYLTVNRAPFAEYYQTRAPVYNLLDINFRDFDCSMILPTKLLNGASNLGPSLCCLSAGCKYVSSVGFLPASFVASCKVILSKIF